MFESAQNLMVVPVFFGRLTLFEGAGHRVVVELRPLVPVAGDIDLQPGRQRVDHRHTDAVQATADVVAAVLAAELAAGVQLGHDHVDGRGASCVHRDRNSASVVGDLDAAVVEQAHVDLAGVAGHRLVDGVVDHLPDEVVQTTLAGGPDIHARAFADGLKALEDGDLFGAVVGLGLLPLGSHGRNVLLGVACERFSHRSGRIRPLYRERPSAPIFWARFHLSDCAVCLTSPFRSRPDVCHGGSLRSGGSRARHGMTPRRAVGFLTRRCRVDPDRRYAVGPFATTVRPGR